MQGFVFDATAFIVSISVSVYLSVMLVLAWKLAVEEPSIRRALIPPLLPIFCQNCGVPFALMAFAFRDTDLALVAVILMLLGSRAGKEGVASLHPSIEVPLLISAIVSFAALAMSNLFI